MTQGLVNALVEGDRFHKNCLMLFDDLIASISDKTLRDNITDLVGPEGGYWVSNVRESEHRRQYVFGHDSRIRFVLMLVKTKEPDIRGSSGYRAVCRQLGVDMVFPLLLVTGVFEPRDTTRFRNNLNLRRNWLSNTLLLGGVPETIRLLDPALYCFNQLLTITSPDGTDSWWCEKAAFKLRRLNDIRDSQMVEEVVDELLKL
jgi:hypothetical protein